MNAGGCCKMTGLVKYTGFTPSRFPVGHPNHPNAVPRFQPADEGEERNGVLWIRNFPRICPFCRVLCYTYAPQPWPTEPAGNWTPHGLEWGPFERGGHRETCGSGSCIQAAQKEHDAVTLSAYEDRRNAAALKLAEIENEKKMAEMKEAKKGRF